MLKGVIRGLSTGKDDDVRRREGSAVAADSLTMSIRPYQMLYFVQRRADIIRLNRVALKLDAPCVSLINQWRVGGRRLTRGRTPSNRCAIYQTSAVAC